jgi:glycosyltransferase 2 family protein
MLMRVPRGALWLVAWAVATILIVWLVRTVSTPLLVQSMARADASWLLLAIASFLCIQPLGALQWRAMLPSTAIVSRRRMLALFSMTSVANNTTPSLIGHATGVVLLAAEAGVGKTSALAVLALDQIAVGLIKILVLVAAVTLVALPVWMREGLTGLCVIIALLLTSAFLASRRRWAQSLDALRRPAGFPLGVAFALGVRIAEAAAIAAVQHAFGLELPAYSVLVVLAATALGSLVPLAPANIGTYEAATFGAYHFLGLSNEAALGVALVQHACQLVAAIVPGYLLLARSSRIWRTA